MNPSLLAPELHGPWYPSLNWYGSLHDALCFFGIGSGNSELALVWSERENLFRVVTNVIFLLNIEFSLSVHITASGFRSWMEMMSTSIVWSRIPCTRRSPSISMWWSTGTRTTGQAGTGNSGSTHVRTFRNLLAISRLYRRMSPRLSPLSQLERKQGLECAFALHSWVCCYLDNSLSQFLSCSYWTS